MSSASREEGAGANTNCVTPRVLGTGALDTVGVETPASRSNATHDAASKERLWGELETCVGEPANSVLETDAVAA